MVHIKLSTCAMRIPILAFLLLIGGLAVHAQFAITQVAFPSGSALDVTAYPAVRAQIRCTYKGQPVVLGSNTAHVLETNIGMLPSTVTHTGNGIHIVEWFALRFGLLNATIVASYEGETASTVFSSALPLDKGATVVVRDSVSRNVPKFVDFGRVPAGSTDTLKLKVVATQAALSGTPPHARSSLLESITTTQPQFKVIWKGSFGSGPLPTNILSPLEYRIDLVCSPTTDEPISDVLTVTFEGGMRTTVQVVANPSAFPRRTILRLTSPNGGETLAPCQMIPITWSGMVSGFYAHLEFTSNNGRTWEAVDSTLDSTYMWTVPESYSDSARIRVYQKFEATSSMWLQGPQASVTAVAYSADGRYLISGHGNGSIIEWDVVSGQRLNTYTLGNLSATPIQALCYIGTGRNIAAVAVRANTKGGTVLRFNQGTPSAVATQAVPADVLVARVSSDVAGSVLYLLPKLGARIPRLEPETLAPLSNIVLGKTAASTSMNGSIIVASMLDGEVVTYSSVDGRELDRSQTGIAEALGPYTAKVAASVTGRLVALAGPQLTSAVNEPREQRTYIYDMATDKIVKILYREGSDVVNLTFSPSDAYLGLGFEFNPQFVVYDLASARTLPPSGSAAGHANKLTDIAFSPDGSTIVTSSIDSTNNLLLRRVSVPESDVSDSPFRIVPVQMNVSPVTIATMLVGSTRDTVITASVCNPGPVMAIITDVQVPSGSWLRLATPFVADTVQPGECLTLHLEANVLDTGRLVDTVYVQSCGTTFAVPVQVTVVDRQLTLLIPEDDFGDLCVGSSRIKRLSVLRNDDPVPVMINDVFVEGGLGSAFRIVESVSDSILQPGATLEVVVEFVPAKLGLDTGVVIIQYANQQSVRRTVRVLGRGSGADLILSHATLQFIPEIVEREITITNNSENRVRLDSASITAGEPFDLLTAMPLIIEPGEAATIRIRYTGGVIGNAASITLSAQPCAAQAVVRLASYVGTATVAAPRIVADPRSDTTSLPIVAIIQESIPYDGVRFFEGILRVHPRLYLANGVSSSERSAVIVSQNVVGDWREIHFRVEGRFADTIEIVRLVGHAGMAAVDVSPLILDSASLGFGSTIPVTYTEGELRIEHPDPRRRIITTGESLIVQAVYPQPATSHIELTVASNSVQHITVRLLDASGIQIVGYPSLQLQPGDQQVQVDVSTVPSGLYTIELDGNTTVRYPVVVVR